MAEAVSHDISSPGRTAEMAITARPLIFSRYEQSYVRRCLLNFYQEITK